MHKKTKFTILFLSILILVFMVACSNEELIVNDEQTGILEVNVQVPEELITQSALIQSVTDEIDVSELEISVSQNDEYISKVVDFQDDSVTDIAFGELSIGTWDIEVKAKDYDDIVIYSGTENAEVIYNTTAQAKVDLYLEKGNLEVDIDIPEDLEITGGEISLIRPNSSNITSDITIDGKQGSASFNDIQSTTWPIQVKLTDSSGTTVLKGEEQITTLPGRTNYLSINFNEGAIEVDISWELAPEKPTGLSYTTKEEGITLHWKSKSDNIAGYLIYRSESIYGYKSILNENLIDAEYYSDNEISTGESYYYWIQAYTESGLSSDLSDPILVPKKYNGKDYFTAEPGHGIKYNVTVNPDSIDTEYWVIGQDIKKAYSNEFLLSLNDINNPISSVLGGNYQEDYLIIGSGMPSSNEGNYYMGLSIPNYFFDGEEWSVGDKNYSLEILDSQTINGKTFEDCIKVYYDNYESDRDYMKGEGYFILAKNIGVIEIEFNRSNGDQIVYQYLENQTFDSFNISGTITEDGTPVEGIRVQISSFIGAANESITDENGAFSIDVYGPITLLKIGYESSDDNNLIEPVKEYPVYDISSDITDLNIDINNN